jgi:hypothetical protein
MSIHAVALLFVLLFKGCGGGPPPPKHYVSLKWNASPTVGAEYNVYRAQGTATGGTFTRLNPAFVIGTTFNDTSVAAGATYRYLIRAVAGPNNIESVPSNILTISVPSP